jgi:transcriptional regulator
MYCPTAFRPAHDADCLALMRSHPLATVVLPTGSGLLATPLPWLLREGPDGLRLAAHMPRANPLAQAVPTGEALLVFMGPQGYVSPGWYPSKQEHGKVVPTWNYATVHAHGTLRLVDDAAWVRAQIEALTRTHEAGMPQPWAPGDAPADFIERLVATLVGVELVVTRLEGKFKLSQNRPAADQAGVRDALAARAAAGDAGAAALLATMPAAS